MRDLLSEREAELVELLFRSVQSYHVPHGKKKAGTGEYLLNEWYSLHASKPWKTFTCLSTGKRCYLITDNYPYILYKMPIIYR